MTMVQRDLSLLQVLVSASSTGVQAGRHRGPACVLTVATADQHRRAKAVSPGAERVEEPQQHCTAASCYNPLPAVPGTLAPFPMVL